MLNLIHLSDLHLRSDLLTVPAGPQGQILECLESALTQTKLELAATAGESVVVVSGDIFDSASMSVPAVGEVFDRLLGILDRALGSPMVLLLPGNHDVRFRGIIRIAGIWPRNNVVAGLRTYLRDRPQLRDRILLCGHAAPRLLWPVPRGSRPVDMVAYDSTYLPYGLFSAGGMVRAPDLLSLLPKLGKTTRPLLLVLHHHLIPTPVADFTLVQRLLRGTLKRLASNADYEEVMQTALGAGSALSGLQRLGRPVLVLHGHKHYPSVRLLAGAAAAVDSSTRSADLGDILLLSAGAAGMVQEYVPGHGAPLPIWPSFNLVRIDDAKMEAHVVVYPPNQEGDKRTWVRPLFSATRHHTHWRPRRCPSLQLQSPVAPPAPRLERNQSVVRIDAGRAGLSARRSLHVERILDPGPYPRLSRYAEGIDCAKDATIRPLSGAQLSPESSSEVLLVTDGRSSFEVANALYVFADDFAAAYDKRDAPFESVELLNRYSANQATLSVCGLTTRCGRAREECFASVTDLTLGTESPFALEWTDDVATITVRDCPARYRLRVYWPLEIRQSPVLARLWRAVGRSLAAAIAFLKRRGRVLGAPARPGDPR